jgi:hypothetical protein
MQTNRRTWKKIAAVWMLGLFVFIAAGKNVHQHNNVKQTGSPHEQAVVHNGFDCPVCEFQVVSDADMPDLPETNLTCFNEGPGLCFYSRFFSDVVVFISADRGPPALT